LSVISKRYWTDISGSEMKDKKETCIFCAWRENCNKKFSLSGRDIRCPDFVRDLKIKAAATSEEEFGEEKRKWHVLAK